METCIWRPAHRCDIPSLRAFLLEKEHLCVGLSSRLLVNGTISCPPGAGNRLWLAFGPSRPSGPSGRISGAVLCGKGHPLFPILPDDPSSDSGLAGFLKAVTDDIRSIIGPGSFVGRVEEAAGISPTAIVDYHLLEKREPGPRSATRPYTGLLPMHGLEIREARKTDFSDLVDLQTAYEMEEVYGGLDIPDAGSLRHRLAQTLGSGMIRMAFLDGVLAGKAQTNARGLGFDQIGGVYTIPALRGRGIAGALVGRLCCDISARGRKSVLYAKTHNMPALSLYRNLGFVQIGDYAAHYF